MSTYRERTDPRTGSRAKSWTAAAALLLALACTTVGPDYEPPEIAVPGAWREGSDSGLLSGMPELSGWWRHFDDPILDELIARSTHQSLDLRVAYARLREARALRGVTAAARAPTVDALGSYEYIGESDNTPFGSFVPDTDLYSIGFDAIWELDLWGRVRRSIEAADAELAASVEDLRDTAVLVAAEVARNYVELRAFQRRIAIARENVSLQEQTLALVVGRNEAGLVGEGDVAQARTNLETTRSSLPPLEVGVRAAEHRLAVLLGTAPGTLKNGLLEERPIPVPPLEVAVGVPAELLRRRADVRRAERILAAETARIGVAQSELYPHLSLHGELGLASDSSGNLLESDSAFFGLGPSLRWNVFDAGRVRELVAAQEARTEQALAFWEQAVLLALEESENAMVSFVREQVRRESLREASAQAGRAVEFARAQYSEGLSDFQAVLVTERSRAVLEDDLAVSDATIATQFVALCKALGGGWEDGDLGALAMTAE